MITFPESTLVGKTVPKTAFYKNLEVNARMKQRFVDDVASVTWVAKIAPSTLNVTDGKAVMENKEREQIQKNINIIEQQILKEKQPKKRFELHQKLVKLKAKLNK